MSKFSWGKTSRANMVGCHPDIIRLANRVIEVSDVDITIIHGGGFRTLAQAKENVRNGRGILNSLHREQPDGYGHAIDFVAYIKGHPNWNDLGAYKEIARATEQAGAELMIPFRAGCDWDMDGVWGESGEYDWPHKELPKPQHMARAIELMNRNRLRLGIETKLADVCKCCGQVKP